MSTEFAAWLLRVKIGLPSGCPKFDTLQLFNSATLSVRECSGHSWNRICGPFGFNKFFLTLKKKITKMQVVRFYVIWATMRHLRLVCFTEKNTRGIFPSPKNAINTKYLKWQRTDDWKILLKQHVFGVIVAWISTVFPPFQVLQSYKSLCIATLSCLYT